MGRVFSLNSELVLKMLGAFLNGRFWIVVEVKFTLFVHG